MGSLIQLGAWREAKEHAEATAVERLHQAMHELELRVESGHPLTPSHETDLLAITGAMSLGMYEEAAERIERLAVRVVHPAGRGG